MSNKQDFTLLHPTEVTGSGSGDPVEIGDLRSTATVIIVVASLNGTKLTVQVETSPDQVTWRKVEAVTFQTPDLDELVVVGLDRYVRASWDLVGTSSKMSIAGSAAQLYANAQDLAALNLGQEVVESVAKRILNLALHHASGLAAGYLGARFSLPLHAWGYDLTGHTASVAAYRFMVSKGYAPEGSDEHIRKMYEDAIAWFERVAKGELTPGDIVDSTPDISEGGPVIVSTKPRGW